MKKLFVGGMGGSGTRVVQMMLEIGGYYIGSPYLNNYYDFMGVDHNFVILFDKWFFEDDDYPMKEMLNFSTTGRDSWSFKHGHLMFCIDKLKQWYPDSEYIHVVRNPIDNMLNAFDTHIKYGSGDYSREYSLEEKIDFYGRVQDEALNKADYFIRLEDLCFDTDSTVAKLFEFAELSFYDIEEAKNVIIIPPTIGRGREFYGTIEHPIFERLGYK